MRHLVRFASALLPLLALACGTSHVSCPRGCDEARVTCMNGCVDETCLRECENQHNECTAACVMQGDGGQGAD